MHIGLKTRKGSRWLFPSYHQLAHRLKVSLPKHPGKMSHSPEHSFEDKEKGSFEQDVGVQHRVVEAAPDDVIVSRFGFMGGFLSKMFASGVEARGVERVPEDQRETKNTWNKYVKLSQTPHSPALTMLVWQKLAC